jgi:hypothetical protein
MKTTSAIRMTGSREIHLPAPDFFFFFGIFTLMATVNRSSRPNRVDGASYFSQMTSFPNTLSLPARISRKSQEQ